MKIDLVDFGQASSEAVIGAGFLVLLIKSLALLARRYVEKRRDK